MNQTHKKTFRCFSFWEVDFIFALTAVTVFVVVYAYKNRTASLKAASMEFSGDLEKLPAHAACDCNFVNSIRSNQERTQINQSRRFHGG